MDEIVEIGDHWVPSRYRSSIWTRFVDASLVEVGTVLFNPHRFHNYVGVVTSSYKKNGWTWYTVTWYTSSDTSYTESYTAQMIECGSYYWLDPVMQP